MAPPDGERSKRLPALTWEPVVETAERGDLLTGSAPDAPGEAAVETITLAPLAVVVSWPDEVVEVMEVAEVVEVADVAEVMEVVEVAEVMEVAEPSVDTVRVVEHGGPRLPSVQAPTPRPPSAVPPASDRAAFTAAAPRQQPRKRRARRRGLKLFTVLVVVGGIAGAGVVFGRQYLFPGGWDRTTAPYAEAVEAGRGVDFAEPLAIVAEPTDEFSTRLQTQLGAVSDEELAQWRALGLASGLVDADTLASGLRGWQDALYSPVDGQVYSDSGVAGAELDARLVQEMTAASLDQEFGWSLDQAARTLDAAASTSAQVLRQSRALQQSSSFDATVPPVSGDVATTLPAVIGYRLLAPHVFAEFDTSITPAGRTNPLAGLGVAGPGIFGGEARTVAGATPTLDGGITATPAAKDRSFWYLVFAAYLDARTAQSASGAVVESALTTESRAGRQCVSATFTGSGVEQTATLRSALTAWAAAAPVEMASSFQVLPDGTLQLVSCDPGVGFDARVRPGTARELSAWRMAELATAEAVRAGGGGEAQLLEAWSFVQASPVALDLMASPASTPVEMAAQARAAVNALFTPAG